MNQRIIAEIGKSQRLCIVNRLKRTHGLSVGQLSEALGMSYMGVKQHCLDLQQRGYLDTWRRPKPVGRPELIYRLTEKANELFPAESDELSLELLLAAQALYGPSSPEKLLFLCYQRRAEAYLARLKGETLEERARWLARQRDSEGYMAELEVDGAEGLRIVEHHSPIAGLFENYPALLHRLEEELFAKVLGATITRTAATTAGLYSCTFSIQKTTPTEAD